MSFAERQQQPILILDPERCKRNIRRMAERAREADCIFRPHFKTHQSKTIGRWFRDVGVTGITVSSVSMAAYFCDDGWNDITIAFPFFPRQVPALKSLEEKCRLRFFIHSPEDLILLDKELKQPFSFFIEIDPGSSRSGISFKNITMIEELIHTSETCEKARFHGFYIHDGRTYTARSKQEINEKINPTIDILTDLKEQFPGAKISLGDTPSASVSDRLHKLDELTPGNFVFYDYMQVCIGSCSLNDVALYAELPVAQKIPSSGYSILHGGAVHLSKEYILINDHKSFGQVVNFSDDRNVSEVRDLSITSLSQEHGTLNGLPVDERGAVWVCPVHSCLTANLHREYFTPDGERIEKRILS